MGTTPLKLCCAFQGCVQTVHKTVNSFFGNRLVALRQNLVKLFRVDINLRIADLLQPLGGIAAALRTLVADSLLRGRFGAFVALAVVDLLRQLNLTLIFACNVGLFEAVGVIEFLLQLADFSFLL